MLVRLGSQTREGHRLTLYRTRAGSLCSVREWIGTDGRPCVLYRHPATADDDPHHPTIRVCARDP